MEKTIKFENSATDFEFAFNNSFGPKKQWKHNYNVKADSNYSKL